MVIRPKKQICCHESLQKGGIELTAHRKRVFDVITASTKALTPKVILTKIRRNHPMDKVTLYRILDFFASKKVVRRIASQQGHVYYEIVCDHHRPLHSHFICRECGDVECLEDLSVSELRSKLWSHRRWQDNDIDLKLEGICNECQKKGVTRDNEKQ
jgi:Fur family transcriptional regulator, ferric uptake regulator